MYRGPRRGAATKHRDGLGRRTTGSGGVEGRLGTATKVGRGDEGEEKGRRREPTRVQYDSV